MNTQYNARERLETTIANIDAQGGQVLWDDRDALEELVGYLKLVEGLIAAIEEEQA